MNMVVPTFKYTGIALPLAATAYVMFSTAGLSRNFLQHAGIRRFIIDFKHSHDFTLNNYKSSDGGVTWVQVGTAAIVTPANASTARDFFVEGYEHWECRILNGGTTQTLWDLTMWGTDERSSAA